MEFPWMKKPAPRARKALLIGCGSEHSKRVMVPGDGGDYTWNAFDLTTLDINPDHDPDIVFDLESGPWPFSDNFFDRVDAYEVLEHLGRAGDVKAFFRDFSEAYRVLKPNGHLCATCPSYKSTWAWGDPSHTRVITAGSLVFLSQREYLKQVGITAMSDFRYLYKGDFEVERDGDGIPILYENDSNLRFALRAIKPSRWKPPVPRKRRKE